MGEEGEFGGVFEELLWKKMDVSLVFFFFYFSLVWDV